MCNMPVATPREIRLLRDEVFIMFFLLYPFGIFTISDGLGPRTCSSWLDVTKIEGLHLLAPIVLLAYV